MTSDFAINVEHLTKRYYIPSKHQLTLVDVISDPRVLFQHKKSTIVDDISFSIKKGETVGIIGRNGTGKSTLLFLEYMLKILEKSKLKVKWFLFWS